MNNPLTRAASFKFGPIVLGTLVEHYFERIKKDNERDAKNGKVPLMHDELLYDSAFKIVKSFLESASLHTVEDVQAFSNTRTPAPPWVRVVRLVVPLSCCDESAKYLIQAFGGEEKAKQVIGGTRWWQVRGVNGVNAQWITAKKDWREAKKRYHESKKRHYKGQAPKAQAEEENAVYEKEMDEMRCILYSHGGGYYFGSVDQERYSIQRHARKINGRVFAVDYRLAPQYPFPCALQDILAAYLFLIRPPPGAAHRPVKPAHIVLAGDSAGGGLSLALLQVIRDTGLPLPAGGVLISPWCDLTHSFPSIHLNTKTDVIPVYGLCMQKPSTLWPPPPEEMTTRVQSGLRRRISQFVHSGHGTNSKPAQASEPLPIEQQKSGTELADTAIDKAAGTDSAVDVGTTAQVRRWGGGALVGQAISLKAANGETLEIKDQIQLYAQNSLLPHPLISPAFSYLGGLPPLLFIASDGEVLRDECIYAAHKAAYPDQYPVKEESRELYPPLVGIEERYKPTPVHLQVYDDCAHVLPVLFSFTTPGKYCFRAIATFIKHVTGMAPLHPGSPLSPVAASTPKFGSAGPRTPVRVAGSGDNSAPKENGDVAVGNGTEMAPNGNATVEVGKAMKGDGTAPEEDGITTSKEDRIATKEDGTTAEENGVPTEPIANGEPVTYGTSTASPESLTPLTENPPARTPPPHLPPTPATPASGLSMYFETFSEPPSPAEPNGVPPVDADDGKTNPKAKELLAAAQVDDSIPTAKSVEIAPTDKEGESSSAAQRAQSPSASQAGPASPGPTPGWTSPSEIRWRVQPDSGAPVKEEQKAADPTKERGSVRRSLSSLPGRAASAMRKRNSSRPRSQSLLTKEKQRAPPHLPSPRVPPQARDDSADVGGPRMNKLKKPSLKGPADVFAGDHIVYSETPDFPSYRSTMIRERVSTRGIIRPLEPESELSAFTVPAEVIGAISELAVRRYIDGRAKFDKKFASTITTIAKHRNRNLERAKKDTLKNMTQLQGHISSKSRDSDAMYGDEATRKGVVEGLMASSGSWSWAWALDGDEHPPPSSIVSRRDTGEARRLARIADQSFLSDDSSLSANNLWSVIVNSLTATPDKGKTKDEDEDKASGSGQHDEQAAPRTAETTPTS